MKTHYKLATLALALALGTGGSLVLAQSPAPTVSAPPTGTVSSTGMRRGPSTRGGQPYMEAAILRLKEARAMLDHAEHDKGGFREKAIESTDRAIHDVQDGIDYARDHPEEFRGERGRGEGPRGTASYPPPAGS